MSENCVMAVGDGFDLGSVIGRVDCDLRRRDRGWLGDGGGGSQVW